MKITNAIPYEFASTGSTRATKDQEKAIQASDYVCKGVAAVLGTATVISGAILPIAGAVVALPTSYVLYNLYQLYQNSEAGYKAADDWSNIDYENVLTDHHLTRTHAGGVFYTPNTEEKFPPKAMQTIMNVVKHFPTVYKVIGAAAAALFGFGFTVTCFSSFTLTGLLIIGGTSAFQFKMANELGINVLDSMQKDEDLAKKLIERERKTNHLPKHEESSVYMKTFDLLHEEALRRLYRA
jgi:hypothetical protein